MAESFKSWSAIQADLADNQVGTLTARKHRDALNSFRAFGGLLVVGGVTATGALSTAYTAITQWTGADANGTGTTANSVAGSLTVDVQGLYEVQYDLCFSISNSTPEYQLGLLKNSETTPTTGTKRVYLHTSNTAYLPVVGHFVVNLAAGDFVKLAVAASAGTPTITPKEGSLYIKRIA
jgi:hypothetical protein